ncbi:prolyl oligopeptidase family serine peptidase [Vibrio sp. CAU 1672]|uniref:prolyl oligopeptidase family serine peptidase n=1 Tax=Vibrio sp. CAU 1672 TaxID=3032594 RepID=UPI0023DC4AC0|nr:prolyl oligopeptidase family serine peptidase [Vibrio sp. CAU 1672]MDF2152675.1 prolyl oligopeptidase family serine peptidase [Vibrio sp. CAU 1672]
MKILHVFCGLILMSSFQVTANDIDWLRDDTRQDPAVLGFLQAHNEETEHYQARYESLTNQLLEQWQSQSGEKAERPWLIKQGHEWQLSSQQGRYVLLRRTHQIAEPEIVYDFAPRQAQHAYYRIGQWVVQGSRLLFSEDTDGSEQYRAVMVNLESQQAQVLAEGVDAGLILSPTAGHAYVIDKEPHTQRPFRIVQINTSTLAVRALWHEPQSDWLLSFYPAADEQYAVLQSNSESTTAQRILDMRTGELSAPLRQSVAGLEYYADIAQGKVYINSNQNGAFSLYSVPLQDLDAPWQRFSDSPEPVTQFYLFEAGVVVLTGVENESLLSVFSYAGELKEKIRLGGDNRVAWLSTNGDFTSNRVRIRSMAMTVPPLWEEFSVKSLERRVLSQDNYPNFASHNYVSARLMVDNNGVHVPVSLAYRKDKVDAASPVVLYGYGAYGFTMKPYFMPQIISLLDQGVIYAIAHVRGGGYFGQAWHEQGRGIHKANSVQDFVAVAKTLQTFLRGRRGIYAMGSSAGGTLVAAAINQEPGLFAGAVLNVPFVDVVASMSDPSLPLTAQQYGEWGNPSLTEQRAIMQGYDPILNVTRQAYPPLLVQVGLNDQRVPYWEGAKYLEKIAGMSTATGPYLLHTDFSAGHRVDARKAELQQAKEYAFLLSLIQSSKPKAEQ